MSTSDKHDEVADHEKEFEDFIAALTAAPELEPIVSEIGGARLSGKSFRVLFGP